MPRQRYWRRVQSVETRPRLGEEEAQSERCDIKEKAKNAKRHKAAVDAVTHGIILLETIAVRGLGTVDSLEVKD
jgi:hypothetical protein